MATCLFVKCDVGVKYESALAAIAQPYFLQIIAVQSVSVSQAFLNSINTVGIYAIDIEVSNCSCRLLPNQKINQLTFSAATVRNLCGG
jgi:hypothetical protein